MWIKNLQLFRFTKPFGKTAEELNTLLQEYPLDGCGNLEQVALGWLPPVGRNTTSFVHAAGGCIMICLGIEEKIMPAAAVKDLLEARAEEQEEKLGHKLSRHEKNQLKDEVVHDMLPRAFTQKQKIYAYIDTKNSWLIVDSTSRKKAEDFAEFLRMTIGTLPVAPPEVNSSPSTAMTSWLTKGAPSNIVLESECELQHPDKESGTARFKNMDIAADEVIAHINTGKYVTKVAINWHDKISCIVTQELEFKRLRFSDAVIEEAADQGGETDEQRFDADFAIMTYELAAFVNGVFDLFGGMAAAE